MNLQYPVALRRGILFAFPSSLFGIILENTVDSAQDQAQAQSQGSRWGLAQNSFGKRGFNSMGD